MTYLLLLVLVVVILGFSLTFFVLKKQLGSKKEDELAAVVDRVFGMSAAKVAEQSRGILQADKELIKADLAHKQAVIEKLIEQLRSEMTDQRKEHQQTELTRGKEFTHLAGMLDQHKELTQELRTSTEMLARTLSNNQSRGEWGERIIEDLLRSNGLVEGVHYLRQKKLGTTTARPDILLLLPNKKQVPIDVKFPYAQMQKMSATESKTEQKTHLKQFEADLKEKVDKVAQYIDVGNNTLDYAIMFVPNEAIFSFINQQLPSIVDMAVGKRVLLVSPFTFLIVARTILESYRNFMIADKLKEVVLHVDDFVAEWAKFKGDFEKYGRSIDTLQKDYQNLTSTRTRVLQKKIDAVQSYNGAGIEPVDQIEQ